MKLDDVRAMLGRARKEQRDRAAHMVRTNPILTSHVPVATLELIASLIEDMLTGEHLI